MTHEVREVVSRLRFISKIKENEIVDVQSVRTMPKGIATSVYRTVYHPDESRKRTLNFFQENIKLAIKYYKESSNEKERMLIKGSLEQCQEGIKNHIKTYLQDTMHVSEVETMLECLNIELSSWEKSRDKTKRSQ